MATCKDCENAVNSANLLYECSLTGNMYAYNLEHPCMNYVKVKARNLEGDYKKLFQDLVKEIMEVKKDRVDKVGKNHYIPITSRDIHLEFFYHDSGKFFVIVEFQNYPMCSIMESSLKEIANLEFVYKDFNPQRTGITVSLVFAINDNYVENAIENFSDEEINKIATELLTDEDEHYDEEYYVKCSLCNRKLKYKNIERHMMRVHCLSMGDMELTDLVTIL